MKRIKRQVNRASVEQVLEDGSNSLGAGQLERKFQNVSKELEDASTAVAPSALGVAMNNMASAKGHNADARVIVPGGSSSSLKPPLKRRQLVAETSGASNSDLEFSGFDSSSRSSGAMCVMSLELIFLVEQPRVFDACTLLGWTIMEPQIEQIIWF